MPLGCAALALTLKSINSAVQVERIERALTGNFVFENVTLSGLRSD
jgi:hypothetical protein